jgi:ribosomal protein S18 acetylase RimI-like enzyme
MSFSLRFMTAADVTAVERFYNSLINFKLTTSAYQHLTTASCFALLLFENREGKSPRLIGLGSALRIWSTSFTRAREGYIPMIGVHRSFQRRGFGSLLLAVTLRIIHKFYSCRCVMAHVQKVSNPGAFEFFKKNQMFAHKVVTNFYTLHGDQREDALFLARHFEGEDDQVQFPDDMIVNDDVRQRMEATQKLGIFARWTSEP